jgi:hypothetical protein
LRKTSIIVLIFALLFTSLLYQRASAQALTLTALTDKSAYSRGNIVTIYGNLSKDSQPVSGALVGIQVKTSTKTIVIRTVQTQPGAINYSPIYVWSVIPCDINGAPQSSFSRNSMAYFKVNVTNFSNEALNPTITVNLFDANQIPIGYASGSMLTLPGDPYRQLSIILGIPIPSFATSGSATAYAGAFSDFPDQNGTPYSAEKNATFQIAGGGLSATSLTTPNVPSVNIDSTTNGSYSLAFQIYPFGETGTYTINATTQWEDQMTSASLTFTIYMVGDVNQDGSVDSTDLGLLGLAWGTTLGDPNWNPSCDLYEDGAIDSSDLGVMGLHWGYIS